MAIFGRGFLAVASLALLGLSKSLTVDSHTGDAKPVTALEERASFNESSDFKFDLLGSKPTKGPGGEARMVTAKQLPALQGAGVAISLYILEPCGINMPHIHPRATEILYVVSGSGLRTAFAEENGSNRTVVNELKAGEITFFPQGLIHYQQNLGCEPVTYIQALNNEDPGTITIATHLFDLPDEALSASLNVTASEVERLHDGLPQNPALGKEECKSICGLQ